MEVLLDEVPASAIAAAVVGVFVVLAAARNNEPSLWTLGRIAAATSLTIGSLIFAAMVVGVGIGLAQGDADQDRTAFFFVAASAIVAAGLGAAVIVETWKRAHASNRHRTGTLLAGSVAGLLALPPCLGATIWVANAII